MITSAFLERAQSTRNNPKKMCPLSNKILLSPLLLGEVSASTLQGLKGIRMLPSRGLVQPMDILHRDPTHCARASDTSKFGSSKFCFLWNELPVDGDQRSAPGALHWVSRGQGVKQPAFEVSSSQRSELTTVEDICRLVMKSAWWHFDKAPISSLAKFWQDVHFQAFTLLFCCTYIFWTMAIEQKASRKKSQTQGK